MTITKGAKDSASHASDLPINEFGIHQTHFVYIRNLKNTSRSFFILELIFILCFCFLCAIKFHTQQNRI